MKQPLGTPDLVAGVSVRAEETRGGKGLLRVGLLDCGKKEHIAESLAAQGAQVVEIPYDTSFDEIARA